MKSATCFGYK